MSMQRYIIEGFLIESDKSGYDINLAMKDNQLFKASFGNIYPTLKKLKTEGLIELKEAVIAGRYKKIYSINEKGRKDFLEWLEMPIELDKTKYEHLIRMYFYQYLPKEKVLSLISDFINEIKRIIQRLEYFKTLFDGSYDQDKFKSRLSKSNIYKENNLFYKSACLQYSIDYLHFMSEWYTKFVNDLSQKSNL